MSTHFRRSSRDHGSRRNSYGTRLQFENNNLDKLNEQLIHAAEKNNLEDVKNLIDRGANNFNTAMFAAVSEGGGNINIVRLLIQHGANNFDNYLYPAILSGHTDAARLFIEHGAKVTESLLYEIVEDYEFTKPDMVELLIEKLNFKNFGNLLYKAVVANNIGIVKLIIEHGVDDSYIRDALIEAIGIDDMDIIKLLIKNIRKDKKLIFNHALIEAIEQNNIELVKFFIDIGANNFNKGLIEAIRMDDLEIVKLLIKNGANNINEALNKALKLNIKTNDNKQIISYLKSQLIPHGEITHKVKGFSLAPGTIPFKKAEAHFYGLSGGSRTKRDSPPKVTDYLYSLAKEVDDICKDLDNIDYKDLINIGQGLDILNKDETIYYNAFILKKRIHVPVEVYSIEKKKKKKELCKRIKKTLIIQNKEVEKILTNQLTGLPEMFSEVMYMNDWTMKELDYLDTFNKELTKF